MVEKMTNKQIYSGIACALVIFWALIGMMIAMVVT